jgi:hypothetical protein
MPLSGLANSCSANRGNGPFGSESLSPFHRVGVTFLIIILELTSFALKEIAKGPVKDTRPLTDKLWQAEKAR